MRPLLCPMRIRAEESPPVFMVTVLEPEAAGRLAGRVQYRPESSNEA
jgi:hypothetical protein